MRFALHPPIRRAFWLRAIGGSLIIGLNLAAFLYFWHQEQRQTLFNEAKALFQKDIVYRFWVSQMGGVYVPQDKVEPNPYLAHVPHRDLQTLDGARLTLANPAYMTRMVHELGKKEYGVRGHITSLQPIRPENKPDPWEAQALRILEKGGAYYSEASKLDGVTHLRYMAPLVTRAECLKCHAHQGYRIGDIRGGISVSLPVPHFWNHLRATHRIGILLTFAASWLLLMLALIVLALRDQRQFLIQEANQKQLLQESEIRNRLEKEIQQAQRLESLGKLAGGVAHDLNNVLGAILGMSEAIRSIEPQSPLMCQGTDTIIKACLRGRGVVQSLLGFARPHLNEPEILDLNTLIREEARLLERTTLSRTQVILELDPDLPKIRGEAGALGHVIMNLAINAIDAMPKGGMLRLSTRGISAEQVMLEVEDTGEGMPPAVLARAFDPFFTTKAPGKGTGLGLSVAYGTIKAHGGTLEVQSEPGQGTHIKILLPALQARQDTAALLPEPAPMGILRILLVDDDELILASIQPLLETLGHGVEVAQGGAAALKRLSLGALPDLVILDMNMPGLGGAEVLQEIRIHYPELPVVLATGYADADAEKCAQITPHTTLIRKPFSLPELKACLQKHQTPP